MGQNPFREDQVGVLAREMQQVHERSAAQVDLIAGLIEGVRQATASEFSAARIAAAGEGVRGWVRAWRRRMPSGCQSRAQQWTVLLASFTRSARFGIIPGPKRALRPG